MTTPFETRSPAAALARGYAPAPKIRVGILLIAGALADPDSARAVDAALTAAGHTPLRRLARLQPRPGEPDLRIADVLAFLALYGHEYALAAFRPWPAARGHEAALIEATKHAGCRTAWEIGPGDTATAYARSGADILLHRS